MKRFKIVDKNLKDSNLSNAYAEIKKYYPNAEVTSISKNGLKAILINNAGKLGSGIENFLTNVNKKYGRPHLGFGERYTYDVSVNNGSAFLFMKDSAIKDSNFDFVKDVFNKYGVNIIKVVNRQDGSKAIYFDKKDKDIYNKPEIMNLYRSGKLRYADSDYFVEVLDSAIKTYAIKTNKGTAVVKAKSKDSAIKFIKDESSAQGYDVVYKETNELGKVFAVLKRHNDFVVVRGYDESTGTYELAYFGFPNEESAKDYLKNLI